MRLFRLLNAPSEARVHNKIAILLCTRASEGAFKSRKSRMKIKLGEEFFEWMTIRQYLVS